MKDSIDADTGILARGEVGSTLRKDSSGLASLRLAFSCAQGLLVLEDVEGCISRWRGNESEELKSSVRRRLRGSGSARSIWVWLPLAFVEDDEVVLVETRLSAGGCSRLDAAAFAERSCSQDSGSDLFEGREDAAAFELLASHAEEGLAFFIVTTCTAA